MTIGAIPLGLALGGAGLSRWSTGRSGLPREPQPALRGRRPAGELAGGVGLLDMHGLAGFALASTSTMWPPCATRAAGPARPGARGADRRAGRRRRHHRASSRGSPAHHRPRYLAADGRLDAAAQSGDGGDRRDAGDRAAASAARRLHRAGAARGAHHRGRPGRGRRAQPSAALRERARRGAHPRLALHRADRRQLDAAKRLGAPVVELHTGAYCEAAIAGDAEPRRASSSGSGMPRAHGASLGLEVHAGHGLTYDDGGRRSRRSRSLPSSTSATSSSARRSSSGSRRA